MNNKITSKQALMLKEIDYSKSDSTFHDALEWFRDNHNLVIHPIPKTQYPDNIITNEYNLLVYNDGKELDHYDGTYGGYNESLSAGLDIALSLIKSTKNYYMNDKDFEAFIESIGGVENGFFTDRPPIKSRHFFSVDNGWLGIIKELIEDLIKLGWNKQTCQVKEKFGGLRFYINSGSDEVHDRTIEAESLSYLVCEKCGNSGEVRNDSSWISTLCDEHNNTNITITY